MEPLERKDGAGDRVDRGVVVQRDADVSKDLAQQNACLATMVFAAVRKEYVYVCVCDSFRLLCTVCVCVCDSFSVSNTCFLAS